MVAKSLIGQMTLHIECDDTTREITVVLNLNLPGTGTLPAMSEEAFERAKAIFVQLQLLSAEFTVLHRTGEVQDVRSGLQAPGTVTVQ